MGEYVTDEHVVHLGQAFLGDPVEQMVEQRVHQQRRPDAAESAIAIQAQGCQCSLSTGPPPSMSLRQL